MPARKPCHFQGELQFRGAITIGKRRSLVHSFRVPRDTVGVYIYVERERRASRARATRFYESKAPFYCARYVSKAKVIGTKG